MMYTVSESQTYTGNNYDLLAAALRGVRLLEKRLERCGALS